MFKQIYRIENRLEDISQSDANYKELWATWKLNKETLKEILVSITKDYPHFSMHDHSHSETILLNIEKFLGNENIDKLSPTDLWLLLHCAYLHDLGMVIVDEKVREIWKSKEFQAYKKDKTTCDDEDLKKAAKVLVDFDMESKKKAEWPLDVKAATIVLTSSYCRSAHADYSKEYILSVEEIWGIDLSHNKIIIKRLISLLAEISSMHTKPFDKIFELLYKETNGFKGDYAHPRLVAVLLRIGDVLDLDNGRFNPYGETIYGAMPKTSKVHMDKHEATKHVLITNKLIEVEADCPTDAIYRETRRWFDTLQDEMDSLHLKWGDIAPEELSYPPKLSPCKILRNGKVDAHELSEMKFSISQSKAFEIIEGSSIYKDKFSCIREIVQNAEDASKIQLWRDIKSGRYYFDNGIKREKVENGSLRPFDIPDWIYKFYSIDISVEKNEKNNAVLRVSDHGTGITIDTLKAICNVGQSYHQRQSLKNEIEEMPVWLRPTASFGIGMQSCFMLTDKLTIYSNPENNQSYKITFKSGKNEGYVNAEPLDNSTLQRGCTVEFVIPNTTRFSFDAFGFTADKLKKTDPFKSDCVVIYKIIESVFKECSESIFNINVVSDCIDFDSTIEAYKFSTALNKESDGIKYYINYENGDFACWYKNNLFKISAFDFSYDRINLKFKGKKANASRVDTRRFIGFSLDIDIYGMSTKDVLSLNRETLSEEAIDIINEQVFKVMQLYFNTIFNNADKFSSDSEIILQGSFFNKLMKTSWKFGIEYPRALKNRLSQSEKIEFLTYNNGYKSCYYTLQDIFDKFPEIPYIDTDVSHEKREFFDGSIELDELIELLNEHNVVELGYTDILIDNRFKDYIESYYYDSTYIENCDKISIHTVNSTGKIYNPNSYTTKRLIEFLVYDEDKQHIYRSNLYTMRRLTPAFEEFSKLAIVLEDIYCVSREGYSRYFIISPITEDDGNEMGNHTKENFVRFVTEKETFSNLVDYVVKHGKEHQSRETIISEYKRLIEKYYDLFSEQ